MASELNINLNEIHSVQSEIESYILNFKKRANITHFPKINYHGKYEKQIGLSHLKNESFFVSIPIKNQEEIILQILQTLLDNSKYSLKIGLLFDNCTDGSLQKVKSFFDEKFKDFSFLQNVYILESEGELFESTCENILFLLCDTKYFVSLQADIFLTDSTFFERSLKAFDKVPNLFAISGRAVVSFKVAKKLANLETSILGFKSKLSKIIRKEHGVNSLGFYVNGMSYFGDTSNYPFIKMKYTLHQLHTLFLGDAVIRGPIIWKSEIFRELNGFNDLSYFLGRDDCDISYRAFLSGYVVSYLPSTSYSIPAQGTTRKLRSAEAVNAMQIRIKIAEFNPGELSNFWNNKSGFFNLPIFRLIKVFLKGNLGGYRISL
jgi:GT2 family glycosyltransferase